jgi:DNA (cytosine-5)-methyltransferase 1
MNLELFCCSGGLAEGLRRAGVIIDLAFDFDEDACASYERNLGQRPVKLDVRDLARMVRGGWRPGPIDLLVADPPCTPWSRAGKRRGLDDERDMIDVTVELVRCLRPRAYLIANVPGLDDGPNWPIVQKTIGSLSRDGYCVLDFEQLDAANFGVPQHRVRPFWYGHLEGPCLRWPARTHGAPEECVSTTIAGVEPLQPWVTCRQALAHLSPSELGTPVGLRWRGCKGNQVASILDRPARVVGTSNLSDGNVLAPDGRAFRKRHAQGHKPRASLPDAPGHQTGGSRRSHADAIKLSEKAAAILQGFPADWHFAGSTKRARWSQIGMAMPPPLAEAVGRVIVEASRRRGAA